MKRSCINQHQRAALSLFADHRFALPPFVTWGAADWAAHPDAARFCRRHQMGWDITDFGSGRFASRGLVIVCLRNGQQRQAASPPYAEKLLVVGEGQETPTHSHRIKMEDIIVRGGGNLIVEMHNPDPSGGLADTPVEVMVDGIKRRLDAGAPLRLRPGESVTVTRGLWHRFHGERGTGPVFVGEVSQVNDDLTDNAFHDPVGRFADIEDDEPALFPLWNELPLDG
jgi:D-lyxose ketol-isomerase